MSKAGTTATQSPCPTCGHWGPRYILCATDACGHGDVVHLLNDDGTRGACSHIDGPGLTPCECPQYTPLQETP